MCLECTFVWNKNPENKTLTWDALRTCKCSRELIYKLVCLWYSIKVFQDYPVEIQDEQSKGDLLRLVLQRHKLNPKNNPIKSLERQGRDRAECCQVQLCVSFFEVIPDDSEAERTEMYWDVLITSLWCNVLLRSHWSWHSCGCSNPTQNPLGTKPTLIVLAHRDDSVPPSRTMHGAPPH